MNFRQFLISVPVLALSLLAALPALASDSVTCISTTSDKRVRINITETTIAITDLNTRPARTKLWAREDAGIYGYFAFDRETDGGNEQTVWSVRFDLGGTRQLNSIRPKAIFEMEIAYGWESLYFETSGGREEIYRCKKL